MNRKKLVSTILVIVVLLISAVSIFVVQQSKTPDQAADTNNNTNIEETDNMPAAEGFVLNELPEGSFEIQDNTLTDTWGVVLKVDKLPDELKEAEAYTITIGDKTYDLTLNPYNEKVFNGQVSSVDHSQEEVGSGIINKKQ